MCSNNLAKNPQHIWSQDYERLSLVYSVTLQHSDICNNSSCGTWSSRLSWSSPHGPPAPTNPAPTPTHCQACSCGQGQSGSRWWPGKCLQSRPRQCWMRGTLPARCWPDVRRPVAICCPTSRVGPSCPPCTPPPTPPPLAISYPPTCNKIGCCGNFQSWDNNPKMWTNKDGRPAIGLRVIPAHMNHRMVTSAVQVWTRALGMSPIGSLWTK